jgi:NAD(P)-dependent dehydrogenase (short-subunit alcohol dehydrogenase family)
MLTVILSAMEALALERAQVRVNAVTLDLIDTPLLHGAYGAERDTILQNRAANLPGKRVGTADVVAQVILILMPNDYSTGKVIHVDGGGGFVSHRLSDCAYHDKWYVCGRGVVRGRTPRRRRGAD